ncbi:hypothetical protein Dsin_011404 [Dipteronia sinensis]|uniref:MULE transposase domain-containing protein n=1 Tax=Dipteronia sinensis TaxID=43782 RepID=A0AAE0EDS0_9ROSI|nr:hypothetical protein Dsin_011404 [Dipteronia sinensis]
MMNQDASGPSSRGTLVDTSVRLRPVRSKIKDDSVMEILLCDKGHVSKVYVSVVEKVSAEPSHVVSGRSLKPKETMTDMQMEHGLGLLYTKALTAKELAEQNVFGPPDLSYQLLPAYCHQLKRMNSGTVTAIKTDAAQKFEYLFISLNASLVGFQTAIRPTICIDATHLKGKFGGVMFIAACQDANNQVFPLAYGWGAVE